MDNLFNMLQKFEQFKNQIAQSGKDPQSILNELINSGKINKEQLDQARTMAQLFQKLKGGKIL